MSDQAPDSDDGTIQRAKRFDGICDAFETQCSAGNRPSIESFLLRVDGPDKQPLLVELIAIEMHYRRQNGESIALAEYQTRFPGLSVSRLEETIQYAKQGHSHKTTVADELTIDSRGGPSVKGESQLVKYFGDYELLDVIARGWMGIVYRARQVSLNRIVALRMILSGEFASKQEVDRFYSEAKAAALLDHPGIVPIYEVGEHEVKHFFSMTYVEGSSLAAKLNDGPLEPIQAAKTILEVSQAVHYAHEQKVIHRDLKPSNILWDTTSQARLFQVLDINEKHWSAIQFVADQSRVIGVGWQGRRREWNLASEEMTIDYSPISQVKDRERYVRWPAAISTDGQTMAGVVDEKILSGIAITTLPDDPNPPRWMIELSRGLLYTYSKDPESLMAKYRFLTPIEFGAVSASQDLSRDFKWFDDAHDPAAPPEDEWGSAAFGISFSSDGKLVAGGNRDGRIVIYNAKTGQMQGQINGHSALVWSVAFSHDAKMLATGDANGHVHVWDVATQKQICEFSGHNGAVRSLTFVSNNRIASAGEDTLIRILDVRSNDSTEVLRGHTARVNSLVVSVDGKRLFSGSADGTTRVWPVPSEMAPQSNTNLSVLSTPGTRIHGLRLSSDASQIEVVSLGKYAGNNAFRRRDWLLKTISGETLQALTFGSGIADFSKVKSSPFFGKFSPHGLAGIQRGYLDWDMLIQKHPEAAKPFETYPSEVCTDQVFQCITHSEDFNYLVTSIYVAGLYGNGFSIAWQNIRKEGTDFFVPLGCVKLNASWTVLELKGDRYAASVGNEVRIVDLAGNTNLLLGTHSKAVTRVAWGNEGKWVASSDEDGFVKVWDVFDRRPVMTMRNHTGSVQAILFTADSRTLFSAGSCNISHHSNN